ncbi:hypothetical protein LguiA_027779 [Lonicera macranthoides]
MHPGVFSNSAINHVQETLIGLLPLNSHIIVELIDERFNSSIQLVVIHRRISSQPSPPPR